MLLLYFIISSQYVVNISYNTRTSAIITFVFINAITKPPLIVIII